MHPKKSLGQHFLRDPNIARNIVALLSPEETDTVLEIGPGRGALTSILADSGASIVAVEIDGRAVDLLEKEFGGRSNVRILHADVLDCDLSGLAKEAGSRLRIIGNLPYCISSRILFHVLDNAGYVKDCAVMMQREVARRLANTEGTKDYGILSVLTQLHADVSIEMRISPNVFFPKPKVWSSVVKLVMRPDRWSAIHDPVFLRDLVRAAFGKRRKLLANALKDLHIDYKVLPDKLAPMLACRAEQLSPVDFVELANSLARRDGERGE